MARFQLSCHTLEHMLQLVHFTLQPFKPANLQTPPCVDLIFQALLYSILSELRASHLADV